MGMPSSLTTWVIPAVSRLIAIWTVKTENECPSPQALWVGPLTSKATPRYRIEPVFARTRERVGVEYGGCVSRRPGEMRSKPTFPTAPNRRSELPIRSVRNHLAESRAISRIGLDLD